MIPEEQSKDGPTKWRRYEYTGTRKCNGQEKKKTALVTNETHPMICCLIFQDLSKITLITVTWLSGSLNNLLDNRLDHLAINEAACIHDCSESYTCRQQDVLQSEQFDVNQASLHVTIFPNHAVHSVDGKQSTEDKPVILKEPVFVISVAVAKVLGRVVDCERVIQSLKNMLTAKLDEFLDYSVELGHKICLFDYNT